MTKTKKPECIYCHKEMDLSKYHAECDCGSLYCTDCLGLISKEKRDYWIAECAKNEHFVTLKNEA